MKNIFNKRGIEENALISAFPDKDDISQESFGGISRFPFGWDEYPLRP